MNNTTLVYLALGLSIISAGVGVVSLILASRVRFWHRMFEKDAEPENLQEIMEAVASKIKKLEERQDDTNKIHASHTATLTTALQHVGLVRFDSGADDGGNLSFVLAVLDASQSGIIITSLHGRGHNRIYAKSVNGGASEQTLSEEEKQALIQALTKN